MGMQHLVAEPGPHVCRIADLGIELRELLQQFLLGRTGFLHLLEVRQERVASVGVVQAQVQVAVRRTAVDLACLMTELSEPTSTQ